MFSKLDSKGKLHSKFTELDKMRFRTELLLVLNDGGKYFRYDWKQKPHKMVPKGIIYNENLKVIGEIVGDLPGILEELKCNGELKFASINVEEDKHVYDIEKLISIFED